MAEYSSEMMPDDLRLLFAVLADAPAPAHVPPAWIAQYRQALEERFERLTDYLREVDFDTGGHPMTAVGDNQLVITREFAAPRDLVFKLFTESDHLARWWGPTGLSMEVVHLDPRPGGTFHYAMRATSGDVMWGKFVYREITPPERLVYVSSFSNERGDVAKAPWKDLDFPMEVLNILTFTEHDGKTTLHMTGGPINATESEQATFAGMHASMQHGFKGTFDQLDAYLTTLTV